MLPTRRFMRAAIATIVAVGTAAPAYADCYTMGERKAVAVRALQTELMVATLSCRASAAEDFVGQYNVFINKHWDAISANTRALLSHFTRVHGTEGRTVHDRFMTALANDSSHRSMTAAGDFCRRSADLLRQAVIADRNELERISAVNAPEKANHLPDCGPAAHAARN